MAAKKRYIRSEYPKDIWNKYGTDEYTAKACACLTPEQFTFFEIGIDKYGDPDNDVAVRIGRKVGIIGAFEAGGIEYPELAFLNLFNGQRYSKSISWYVIYNGEYMGFRDFYGNDGTKYTTDYPDGIVTDVWNAEVAAGPSVDSVTVKSVIDHARRIHFNFYNKCKNHAVSFFTKFALKGSIAINSATAQVQSDLESAKIPKDSIKRRPINTKLDPMKNEIKEKAKQLVSKVLAEKSGKLGDGKYQTPESLTKAFAALTAEQFEFFEVESQDYSGDDEQLEAATGFGIIDDMRAGGVANPEKTFLVMLNSGIAKDNTWYFYVDGGYTGHLDINGESTGAPEPEEASAEAIVEYAKQKGFNYYNRGSVNLFFTKYPLKDSTPIESALEQIETAMSSDARFFS